MCLLMKRMTHYDSLSPIIGYKTLYHTLQPPLHCITHSNECLCKVEVLNEGNPILETRIFFRPDFSVCPAHGTPPFHIF